MNNLVSKSTQGAEQLEPPLPPTERHYLTEAELANRWGLSTKTLHRWRQLGTGPFFAKFSKRVAYPLHGHGGVLEFEQSILHRSTSELVFHDE